MSFEDEYAGKGRGKKKGLAPWLPVMGLLLAVALGAIAYVLSGPLHELLYNEFFLPQGYQDFQDESFKYLISVILFMVLLTFSGLLYAAFQPSRANKVTERELKKERERRHREIAERKRRKQMINRKVAREREEALRKESMQQDNPKQRR